jgi:hypothetical protein
MPSPISYKIVNNNELLLLATKIKNAYNELNEHNRYKQNTKSAKLLYFNCIGKHHKINHFNIAEDSFVELLFHVIKNNDNNDDSFKITVKSYKINFNITLFKQNKFYQTYKNYLLSSNEKELDYNIVQKNVYAFGITVSDLIKIYYHNNNNLMNTQKNNEDNDDNKDSLKPSELLDKKLLTNFIKKALQHDTSSIDCKNVLGVISNYNPLFHLWNDPCMDNFISNKGGLNNLNEFYDKILYFSVNDIYSLLYYSNKKDNNINSPISTLDTKIFCERLNKMFSEYTSEKHVHKLFKYFYYKIDPEINDSVDCYIFEQPISIPDALKYVYDITKNEKCMFYYNKLTKIDDKKLSELDEKYKPYTVKILNSLPTNYPFFALRYIYITEWNTYSPSNTNTLNGIELIYNNYMNINKSNKLKYKKLRSNNQESAKYRQLYGYCRCDWCIPLKKGSLKENMKEFKCNINESIDMLDLYD